MQFTVTEKRNYVSWGFKNTKNISLHLSIWNCVCVLWPLFVSWLESVKRKITVWKNTCCLTLQPHDNIKRAWCSTTITSAWVSWWGMTQTCCSVESICLRKSGTHHGVWYQLSYIWWFSQIATNDIYSHESIRIKSVMSLSFVQVSQVIAIRLEVLSLPLIRLEPGEIKSSDSDHQAVR